MNIIQNPLLIAFEKVVSSGSVHAASRELAVTQTAITQRIKALEAGLGLVLFLRSRKGMTLTSEGNSLLQYCRARVELEGSLLSRLQGVMKNEISLTLVGPTSAISSRIAENCLPLYQKYSFLRLHLRADDSSDLISLVKRGEADLAIVRPSEVPNEMTSKILKPDKYVLVGSSRLKGKKISEILESERIIDFEENDQTTINYLKSLRLKTVLSRSRIFVNDNEALVRMVKMGVGIATLTESVARRPVEEGRIVLLNSGKQMDDPLALVWYPRSQKMDYFEDLVRAIK